MINTRKKSKNRMLEAICRKDKAAEKKEDGKTMLLCR